MIEKVNPGHPDKVADRIAGAMVDLAEKKQEHPRVAVELLIGHGKCTVIAETSAHFEQQQVERIVRRVTGVKKVKVGDAPKSLKVDYREVPQDEFLAKNQAREVRCGDNGIFKGVPIDPEVGTLSAVVRALYQKFPTDGKFIYDENTRRFIACQSNAENGEVEKVIRETLTKLTTNKRGAAWDGEIIVNPLGFWTGGTDVDSGATNRKLGSDMGRAVTGGGLHGKDLSKADVSVNILCHLLAQKSKMTVEALCAIGDRRLEFRFSQNGELIKTEFLDYPEVVERAGEFVKTLGGFEKLAEWGLV